VPERINPHLISWFVSPQGKEISVHQNIQPVSRDHHTSMLRGKRREVFLEVKVVEA
jgi:hypothetical protein